MNRFLLLLLLAGCQANTVNPQQAVAPTDALAAIERQIAQALPAAQHCSENVECGTLALGHRPCGGPDRYVAVNTRAPSLQKLEQLAAQQRVLAAKRSEGRMGICSVLPVPSVSCQQQRCVSAGAAGAF